MSNTHPTAPKRVAVPSKFEESEKFSVPLVERVPLFRGVSDKNKESLSKIIKRCTLSGNEILVAEDDLGDSIFFLVEGAVKITVRKGGDVVLLGLCGPGELLGELAAIDGNARSATVVAQTPCVVGALSAAKFWSHVWPIAPIPRNMSYLLVQRVRRLTAKVQAMATLDVRGRLAYQIVCLAREHALKTVDVGDVIPFSLTQTELAQMIGTSRVHVNQLLMEWNDQGLVSPRRDAILVHRLDELCQMFPASLDAVAPPTVHVPNEEVKDFAV